ncbi:DMT family transporter [Paenibacillus sp. 1001270B_150601_E10]|uniref:DMT family transporter n=1 Tax=Paenibacillus sp. 1001270B_150601_E10 TaxID=2787079 RepID=UPI00189D78FE|nr:EamA family transporter [Paenibacillus sp. 1001270B_150601_E10]
MVLFNYLLVCLIFGTTFLAVKIGVDAAAPPFLSAGLRFFIAGTILFAWMALRKKASLSLLFRKEMLITGAGLTFGTFATLYWGEQFVPSGNAAILSATGPMMVLVIQMLFLRQKPSVRSLIGCIVGFLGVILLILPSITFSASIWLLLGSIAIVVGELSYSCGILYSKKVSKQFSKVSPIALNAAQMMYGGLLLLILSMLTESWSMSAFHSAGAIGSLIYLIVVGSMIGHSLFYWLVSKTNPVFASTWLYVSPIIALSIGVLFYDEGITWMTVLGALTIIAGTVLVNLDDLRSLFTRSKKDKLQEAKPLPS